MAKINSLRDIIQFNSNFKTAINLYLSLNKAEKVLGYIPTKSSVSFLGEYLKAVLENKEQATLLVGPYGKGKSHLLLVLLAVLSMKKTPESESAINELIDNVKVMLANLLQLIEKLEMDEIVIDRPNYSQRIKLVKK